MSMWRNEINYSAYWQDAWREASLASAASPPSSPAATVWPRIFVYDSLPTPLSAINLSAASFDDIFGPPLGLNGTLRDTNQYGLAKLVGWRLAHSPRYRVPAEQAELFVVPLFPTFTRGFHFERACSELSPAAVLAALPHLSRRTAHRHVLMLGKEHTALRNCTGWWSSPQGVFRHVLRVSYSEEQPETLRPDVLPMAASPTFDPQARCGKHSCFPQVAAGVPNWRQFFRQPDKEYPHLFSLPYASTSAAAAASASHLPWARRAPEHRPLLMLLLGGTLHGDRAVRVRLRRECARIGTRAARRAGDGVAARGQVAARGCALDRYDPHRTLLRKREAVFCLEPGGDTLSRRSFTDSLVLGCIPVLFTALQDHAYGWLWGGPGHGPGGWKAAARVLIDRRQFISGRIRLEALLGSVPWPLVQLMQETIEAHGRKWQVSREDDPGDEVHALLLGAMRAVESGTNSPPRW